MNRDIRIGLAWSGLIIAVAFGCVFAGQRGLIEHDTIVRIVIGLNGILIAWYGNRMPKAWAPSAFARRVSRVTGWSQVLAGLAYAALWVFAPIPVALAAGSAAVILGIAVPLGYCLWLRGKAKAA